MIATAQFVCEFCGEGFEQRSRYERHMAASHPERAPSAADLEHALAGIDFPTDRNGLMAHAAETISAESDLFNLIERLPDRNYRDAAEVAISLGEVK